MLEKVISGGQTGVDQAALRAARRLNIVTGGWAPKGWRTLDGPREQLLRSFGLVEHWGGYAERTWQNVRDAQVTLRVATDYNTAGERCTMKAIEHFKKPNLSIVIVGGKIINIDAVEKVRAFLRKYDVHVLNVAGNSEISAPGIGTLAEQFLFEALHI